MFRTLLLILSGNLFSAVMLMVRNILIARLISVEDYGIAATFLMSMAVVEMFSALGLHQMLIQDKNGNDPHLQAALQGFNLLRGIGAAALLMLIADPLARFLGTEEVVWAYYLLAAVPVMVALLHFDQYRMHRQLNYRATMLTGAVPGVVSVLAVWPLYLLFGDYRVMLFAMLIHAVVTLATSQLIAERPYRLVLDREVMARGLRFGWPLVLSGMLLFLVFNGEKLIVARELGLEPLAVITLGLSLTLTPTLVVDRTLQSFFLPQISAVKSEPAAFVRMTMVASQAYILLGAAVLAGVVWVGAPVVTLLLGAKYAAVIPVLIWLGIQQGFRVLKGGITVASLARGQTVNTLYPDLCRVLMLPVAWWVADRTGDMVLVILVAIIGELAGFLVAMALGRFRLALPSRPLVLPILCMAVIVGLAALAGGIADVAGTTGLPGYWIDGGIAAALGAMLASMGALRRYVAARVMTRHHD